MGRLDVDGRGMVDLGLELTRRLESVGRRVGPTAATAVLIGALAVVAAGLTPLALDLRAGTGPVPGVRLTWWMLLPVFAVAELSLVYIEVREDAHAYTLSELALVLALVFATPGDLVVARLVGASLVLVLVDRVSGLKLAFNLALFWAESCVLLLVFARLGGRAGELDARTWVAALVAVEAASALGATAVWAVIRLHGGDADPRLQLVVAAATTLCNACLAGVAAVLLMRARWALVPLVLVVLVLIGAYRRYDRLARRYAGLRSLHTFTKATGAALTRLQVAASVLDSARDVLAAEVAVLALRPGSGRAAVRLGVPESAQVPDALWSRVTSARGTVLLAADTADPQLRAVLAELDVADAVAAPILSGRDVVGVLLLADRRRGTFDAEDAELLSAMAAQAEVALDRGGLVQQVHDQALAREHEALHDALTGLPNRTLFAGELDRELAVARSDGSRVAVVLLDLDQFKEVNDTLGHHTGDQLLCQVAQRLLDVVGQRGLVARLGGDEFAVLLPRLADHAEATELSRRLHARIVEPIRLDDLRVSVGASIGVAVRPDHGTDGRTLLQRADVAMYSSKHSRDQVVVYDAATDWNSPLRLRLAADLRSAIAGGQLTVAYQPIGAVSDLEVGTVEALARWRHPEFGDLTPDEFIPIAERTGLIGALTDHVLRCSVEQCADWRAAGFDIRVAVNLSVHTLVDPEWPGRVLDLLREHAVPTDRLTFEITESGIMADPERMIAMLDQLAAAGVGFSIDDFGTGHSSLTYLQQLPVSEVKIDKSFVTSMTHDPDAASIVRSVVDLARHLGLRTIAEGVEDPVTLAGLGRMRCDFLQGFHLGRPMSGEHLLAWLAARR